MRALQGRTDICNVIPHTQILDYLVVDVHKLITWFIIVRVCVGFCGIHGDSIVIG